VATDDRLQYREETLKENIASMVCAPIRSRDRVIGVMRLCSDKRRAYPVDFLNLVEAIAHTGALAIQNASMYLTLQRDKERLEEDGWLRRSYF
jgi:GAF domain-containing protein